VFARFFVERPIAAWVISIVITMIGLVAAFTLPIAQYPDITPPTVQVTAIYPGANAKVVADSVAAPIEQQVNGVEGMMYMSSQCTNDGAYSLTITFELGTDLNMAQVLVQNRVALALPLLPQQSPDSRRQYQETLPGYPFGREFDLARRRLRRPVFMARPSLAFCA
jgi:multidrug efflux pump